MHPSPNGIVMSPQNIFLSVFNRFWRGTEPQGLCFQTKAPGVAAEAAELQGAIFRLLCRVEEDQSDAHEGDLDLWQVLSLKRTKTGFSVVGGGITLPSAVHPQGGHCRGYQGGG